MFDPLSSEDPPFVFMPPFEIFYLISLEFCTSSALESAERVMDLMGGGQSGEKETPPQIVLNEVQNIVNQGAAISRYFWPSDKKYRARGEALRNAFGIGDSSPLKDRKLRNMVEHFDEYLDDYLRVNCAGQYVPEYVGSAPQHDRGPLKLFRAFFVDTGQFEILGETYEIQPILDAIGDLHEMLVECHSNGSRFPRKPPESAE
jgi:hypothetical protein